MDSRFRGNDGCRALIPCSAGACPPPPSVLPSFPSSDAGFKPALPEGAGQDEFPAPHGGGRTRESTGEQKMDSRFRGNDGYRALVPCSAGACPPPPSVIFSFPPSDAGCKPALPEDADKDGFPAPHGGGRTRESTGEQKMDSRFRRNNGCGEYSMQCVTRHSRESGSPSVLICWLTKCTGVAATNPSLHATVLLYT